MTRIDFYSNVADSLIYACRLARKAYRAGQLTIVYGEMPRLRAFDQQLWTFEPNDFVPHCMAGTPHASETPIVLCTTLDDLPHHQILLNLGAGVPSQFARFERLLEVVGTAPDERLAARDRYRFYRDRGYTLTNHNQGA